MILIIVTCRFSFKSLNPISRVVFAILNMKPLRLYLGVKRVEKRLYLRTTCQFLDYDSLYSFLPIFNSISSLASFILVLSVKGIFNLVINDFCFSLASIILPLNSLSCGFWLTFLSYKIRQDTQDFRLGRNAVPTLLA